MSLPNLIKKPILFTFHKAVQLNLALSAREYEYVFILGHMRSGSTLLSHILASHPDFLGAGETFTIYRNQDDIRKLIPRTCELLRTLRLRGKYVVDKVTMDQFLSPEVLRVLPIFKSLILIRKPKPSLKSIANRFQWKEEMALHHYVTRLHTLAQYGQILGDRALLVEYDDLIDRRGETLVSLTKFFEVRQAFTESYARSRVTGKMGDPSENIFKGRIIRTPGHGGGVGVGTLTEASRAFDVCKEALQAAGVLVAVEPLRTISAPILKS